MSTPGWKHTASLGGVNAGMGTAEAAAMRDAAARRMAAREQERSPKPTLDALQTDALLSLDARLARLEGASLGYRNLLQAGGGGAAERTPLMTVDASEESVASVRVIPGWVSYAVMPTIGGVSLNAAAPPKLPVSGDGFVVLKCTWFSDFVPRHIPLSAEIIFEAGDPAQSYPDAESDTQTASKLMIAAVWSDGSVVSKIQTVPSGTVVVERQVVSGAGSTLLYRYIAMRG